MKFFLDTAVVDEIREGVSYGLVDGVTTNPSLIAKSGRPFREVIEEICQIVDGPISAEVVSTDCEGMLREGRELAQVHKNIVVKVPLIAEGLKATRIFSEEGIHTNVTLCFSATQALLAAKAGATYISPFVGRLDDISHNGLELVQHILDIYDVYEFDTEVIVASIRNPLHVLDAARMGAHIGTMPLGVMKQLMKHPLTDIGLANFLKDWEATQKG
ncbi:MAG: fructose-6-phosphate aldolase [Nitrospirota bacterium]|nr:fructose-6-phosphate aldolase [Nitrospirota bacterium]